MAVAKTFGVARDLLRGLAALVLAAVTFGYAAYAHEDMTDSNWLITHGPTLAFCAIGLVYLRRALREFVVDDAARALRQANGQGHSIMSGAIASSDGDDDASDFDADAIMARYLANRQAAVSDPETPEEQAAPTPPPAPRVAPPVAPRPSFGRKAV